jgi:hypothetical protein
VISLDALPPVPLPLEQITESALLATSYHEAGHAVALVTLGYAVRYCTLVPRAGKDGHSACMVASVALTKLPINQAITVWLAGPYAEMEHFPPLINPEIERGDWSDLTKVLIALETIHNAEWTAPIIRHSLERHAERTLRLVRREWSWITRVADELMRWRRLSGVEVTRLRRAT